MRIAYFLLPILHPDGAKWDPCHQEARGRLLRTYGGYTQTIVEGAWRNPHGRAFTDTSVRYEIARDWTVFEQNTFKHLVIELAEQAHQESVLIGWPDSTVDILPCDAHKHDGDAVSSSNTVAWVAAEAAKQRSVAPVATDYAERAIDATAAGRLRPACGIPAAPETARSLHLPIRTPHYLGGYPPASACVSRREPWQG
jgi:hypothetical protein